MRPAYCAAAGVPSVHRHHLLPGLPNATVHAGVEIEEDFLLLRVRIGCRPLAVPFSYPRINQAHCAQGVGAEG